MSHDTLSRSVFGVSYETLIRRIVRTFDRASKSDVESGARWYDEAGQLAADLSGYSAWLDADVSVAQAAVVIAHLSPRTTWARNVASATMLVQSGERYSGVIGNLYERAMASLEFADPFDSFGPTARKTHAFARNIAGDREAVTVDVWACRVVDVDESKLKASPRGETSTAYDVLADAYRAAARRRGVDPATMQATTWIVARNGRAS